MELSRYGPNLPTRSVIAVRDRNGVDLAGVDLAEVVHDAQQAGLGVFTEVEVLEPGGSGRLAVGDLVQVRFHVGRELVVHVVVEVLLEQPDHGERDPARDQRGALLPDVAAVLDGGDGGGVGRRAADALLFQLRGQRRFGVARRRRGLVADGDDVRGRERVALGHVRQAACFLGVVVAAAFVLAFFIGGQEAGEGDDGARGGEFGVAAGGRAIHSHRAEADGGGGALGVGHLRGNRALPDQLVEPEFVAGELLGHLGRGAEGVAGGTDGLVGLLGVGGLAGVDPRGLRERIPCRTARRPGAGPR